jgi:hypothetical protein
MDLKLFINFNISLQIYYLFFQIIAKNNKKINKNLQNI